MHVYRMSMTGKVLVPLHPWCVDGEAVTDRDIGISTLKDLHQSMDVLGPVLAVGIERCDLFRPLPDRLIDPSPQRQALFQVECMPKHRHAVASSTHTTHANSRQTSALTTPTAVSSVFAVTMTQTDGDPGTTVAPPCSRGPRPQRSRRHSSQSAAWRVRPCEI